MTREELLAKLRARHFVHNDEALLTQGVTVRGLIEMLEDSGLLGPQKDSVGLSLCHGCNKLHGDWPNAWRWSKKHGAYVCSTCAAKEESTP